MPTRRTLVLIVVLATTASAQTPPPGSSWQTDPAYGARPNVYGPGINSDATGRPFTYKDPSGNPNLEPQRVRPNAYGPGIGMDQYGRPVTPDYGEEK
jgi:hypothetical protein